MPVIDSEVKQELKLLIDDLASLVLEATISRKEISRGADAGLAAASDRYGQD